MNYNFWTDYIIVQEKKDVSDILSFNIDMFAKLDWTQLQHKFI